MKGLWTQRRYDAARERDGFDRLMLVWALVMLLSIYHNGFVFLAHEDGDTVMLPTCEACKTVEPGSAMAVVCWLLGC